MHKLFKTFLLILDGNPRAFRKSKRSQRGQSSLEFALVSPLLVMLIVGIVEIGWYANNLLNLQDVTRVGARRGADLSDQYSPLEWNNYASFVPPPWNEDIKTGWPDEWVTDWIDNYGTTPDGQDLDVTDPADQDEVNKLRTTIRNATRDYRAEDEFSGACVNPDFWGYYNRVVCLMLSDIKPLELKEGDRPFDRRNPKRKEYDDIVVSVFALAAINNDNPDTYAPVFGGGGELIDSGEPDIYNRTYDFNDATPEIDIADRPEEGWNVMVVGRYPTNANECTVADDGSEIEIERDPFDYINNGTRDETPDAWGNPLQTHIELPGMDIGEEYHRGFGWRGVHQVEDPDFDGTQCFGSEWSIEDIEDLMRLSRFDMDTEERRFLTDQGLVLVEIFWRHDLLLQIPITTQVFTWLGSDSNDIYINAWSAFPALAAEPNIVFNKVGTDTD